MRRPIEPVLGALRALYGDHQLEQVGVIQWRCPCPSCGARLTVSDALTPWNTDYVTVFCAAGCSPPQVEAALRRAARSRLSRGRAAA